MDLVTTQSDGTRDVDPSVGALLRVTRWKLAVIVEPERAGNVARKPVYSRVGDLWV
jgi:hypothetical protein